MQRNTNNNNRRRRPRIRQRAPLTKNPISGRDFTTQSRKLRLLQKLPFSNNTTDYVFAYGAVSFKGAPFDTFINGFSRVYEQYRVRNVTVRLVPGVGMDNEHRCTTMVYGRTDIDHLVTSGTPANFIAGFQADNTCVRTLTQRGNVPIITYRPLMHSETGASKLPLLDNRMQWYQTNEVIDHEWRGAVIGALNPDTTLTPGALNLFAWIEIDIDFRGRVTGFPINTLYNEGST